MTSGEESGMLTAEGTGLTQGPQSLQKLWATDRLGLFREV